MVDLLVLTVLCGLIVIGHACGQKVPGGWVGEKRIYMLESLTTEKPFNRRSNPMDADDFLDFIGLNRSLSAVNRF
jgi:hypothetical protein